MQKVLNPQPKSSARKLLRTILHQVRKTAHVGNDWYWLEVPDLAKGIDIASLVCPLRYDVLVRRDFLSFYAAHRDLYFSDFDSFVNLAKQSSYYKWYVNCKLIRRKPGLLGTDKALEVGFRKRIRRSAALYENVLKDGFARQFPIILRTAERLLPPTTARSGPQTGKFVSARYFIADGCHRLALLMAMGQTVLPANHFRVQCFREFSPFDSTILLVRSLPINAATYFAFLSSYYCAPLVFEDGDTFLRHVSELRPEFLKEVLSVIHVDGFDSSISSGHVSSGVKK
jgi:hypothetical protein